MKNATIPCNPFTVEEEDIFWSIAKFDCRLGHEIRIEETQQEDHLLHRKIYPAGIHVSGRLHQYE